MHDDAAPASEDDGEVLHLYTPPFGLDAVAGVCDRLIEHLLRGEDRDELEFEGLEVERAQGVWIAALGAYDPSQDAAASVEPPPGGFARAAIDWTEGVRSALRSAWGEPLVRTPRLVGSEREPEGILDYLLVSVGIDEAEMWDRGALCGVLVTYWSGEGETSMLRQLLVILPRALALGGMSEIASADVTRHAELMHGEHPVELRRRAWIMSTLFGAGEVRLRDVPLEASRCSLQARDGTTTVWTFLDDGRALVLVQDPTCDLATHAGRQLLVDHGLDDAEADASDDSHDDEGREEAVREASAILAARMLAGVPNDLAALVAARAVDGREEPVAHDLEFRIVAGEPIPVISGVAWFDGEEWHIPATLLEIAMQNGFGLSSLGFGAALERPYRLGGAFTVEALAGEDAQGRAWLEPAFDACPHPEQARPSGDARLGLSVPDADAVTIVAHVEGACAAWWERSPETADWRDRTFEVAGRELEAFDERVLSAPLATAESWTLDALRDWSDRLVEAMSARWGQPRPMSAHDERLGADRRSPLSRIMRATGLRSAPMWWVDGHAVLLLAGMPDPEVDDRPQVLLVLCRADAVLDLMRGLDPWALRNRLRVLDALASVADPDARTHVPAQPLSWDGPALEGSTVVPDAVRGHLRTGDERWVWHLTHAVRGPRGLLMCVRDAVPGDPQATFEQQAALFDGVPASLLSLVADRDPAGLYPTVARHDEPDATSDDPLARARRLPIAQSVLWLDGVDWRASDGLLRRLHAAVVDAAAGTGASTADPLELLHSTDTGVPQLLWAVDAGGAFPPQRLAAGGYDDVAVDGEVSDPMVTEALGRLGEVHARALLGSLQDVLDVLHVVDGPAGLRSLLDAALSNPDPRSRREIALWLLERPIDPSIPLSFLTPVNVLLENPTLDADDAPLLARLLARGADPGPGPWSGGAGGHPLVQLAGRDLDEAELEPLVEAWLAVAGDHETLVPPGGGDLVARVERASAWHGRARPRLLARLAAAGSDVDGDG